MIVSATQCRSRCYISKSVKKHTDWLNRRTYRLGTDAPRMMDFHIAIPRSERGGNADLYDRACSRKGGGRGVGYNLARHPRRGKMKILIYQRLVGRVPDVRTNDRLGTMRLSRERERAMVAVRAYDRCATPYSRSWDGRTREHRVVIDDMYPEGRSLTSVRVDHRRELCRDRKRARALQLAVIRTRVPMLRRWFDGKPAP